MPKEYEINSMDVLQARVRGWTAKTFPKATARTAAAHLLSEAVELFLSVGGTTDEVLAVALDAAIKPTGGTRAEAADVTILALDIAGRESFNLYDEVVEKMERNEARRWGKANIHGFFEHLQEVVQEVTNGKRQV